MELGKIAITEAHLAFINTDSDEYKEWEELEIEGKSFLHLVHDGKEYDFSLEELLSLK